MKVLHTIAFILTIVGALNWGLVGLGQLISGANWNLVTLILGSVPSVEAIVYVLVGLSAVYLVFTHKGSCKNCNSNSQAM
jgi:uncharacterized membrane protein YuzA (DUF378 family)